MEIFAAIASLVLAFAVMAFFDTILGGLDETPIVDPID